MSRSEPRKKGPSEPAGARQDELCQDSPVARTTRQTALSPSSTGFRPECLAGNGHGTALPPWTVTDGFPPPPVRPHVGADGPAFHIDRAQRVAGRENGAGPFLQRRPTGRDRFLQSRRSALALPKGPKRETDIRHILI